MKTRVIINVFIYTRQNLFFRFSNIIISGNTESYSSIICLYFLHCVSVSEASQFKAPTICNFSFQRFNVCKMEDAVFGEYLNETQGGSFWLLLIFSFTLFSRDSIKLCIQLLSILLVLILIFFSAQTDRICITPTTKF